MSFQVAIAQINPRLGDVQSNLSLYESKVREAKAAKADLLLFPELSLTGYFLRDMVPTVALKLHGRQVGALKNLSRELPFVAGLVEEGSDYRFYNSAVYFEDGEIRHVHRKVYLPTYGMFDEQRYFARGDRIRAFDSRFGRLALLVCEDLWHPSTVYLTALDGALAVLCPSSSPLRGISEGQTRDDNAEFWEMINRTYAETFGLYIVFGNRVGFEDGVGFWGGSEILDPFGRRTVKAKYYEEDVVVGGVTLESVRRKRTMAPLLRDEDIDLTINELVRIRERPAAGKTNKKIRKPAQRKKTRRVKRKR